jgi:hypothetical protein
MRFDGGYHQNIRHQHHHHQHHHQNVHNPMNENYGGMRYHHPPSNNLATIVTQNIQQRFGTG